MKRRLTAILAAALILSFAAPCSLADYSDCLKDDHEYYFAGANDGMYAIECRSCGDSRSMTQKEYKLLALIGRWTAIFGEDTINLNIKEDGSFTSDFGDGLWADGPVDEYGRFDIYLLFKTPEEDLEEGEEPKEYLLEGLLNSVNELILLTYRCPDVFDPVPSEASFTKLSDVRLSLVEDYVEDGAYHEFIGQWNSVGCSTVNWDSDEHINGVDTSVSLQINEDGSFSGDIMGPVSGTWVPSLQRINRDSLDLRYHLFNEGDPDVYATVIFHVSYTSTGDTMVSLEHDSNGITRSYDIHQFSEEEFAIVEEAIANSENMMLGEWISTEVSNYDSATEQYAKSSESGVKFIFNDDGSFTGELNGPVSGTWEVDEVNFHNGTLHQAYALSFDESCALEEILSADLSTFAINTELNDNSSTAHFSYYANHRSNVYHLARPYSVEYTEQSVTMLPSEETVMQTDQLIIGQWNSVSCQYDNMTTGEHKMESDFDVKLVLNEDGSFAGELNGPVSGTWTEKYSERRTDVSEIAYSLIFSENGESCTLSVFIPHERPEDVSVQFYTIEGNWSKMYMLQPLSEEEIVRKKSEAEETKAFLLGSWKAKFYSIYDNATQQIENLDVPDYTIEFYEDGSFERNFETTNKGEWSFFNNDYGNYYYILNIPGMSSSISAVYQSNDMLNVSWPNDDFSLSYNCTFERTQ